jgi:hypothetical protein
VVGHLFLSACERGPDGRPHPEIEHPRQSWYRRDWYASDPCSDLVSAPLYYGEDIVDLLLSHREQEIGCHSFGHALYDDPEMTDAAVRDDLRRCVQVAAAKGVTLRSFVFPRNREGHHAALRDAGFTAFRGADRTWHARLPHLARRLGHLVDQVAAVPPPANVVRERLPGLWEIPGSMVVMPPTGIRRLVQPAMRARKARAGLAHATRDGGLFHLWAHPFAFAAQGPVMLRALETVLRDASQLRQRGEIEIATMGAIADRVSREAGTGRQAAGAASGR